MLPRTTVLHVIITHTTINQYVACQGIFEYRWRTEEGKKGPYFKAILGISIKCETIANRKEKGKKLKSDAMFWMKDSKKREENF